MFEVIEKLNPFRWKVFQVLVVTGENEGDQRKRDATKFIITDEQFDDFCKRHSHLKCMIPEPNRIMKSSYLVSSFGGLWDIANKERQLVDEYMRFLDKGDGDEKVSQSILEVGVQTAIKQIRWDQETFSERGGIFDWSKPVETEKTQGCGGIAAEKEFQWWFFNGVT